MTPRPIFLSSLATVLLICSSCSKQGGQEESREKFDTPDVAPTAAPGVAWKYAYDFQLPDSTIDRVQEQHASECEGLGITRCRITGLRYTVNDDNAVSAMLEANSLRRLRANSARRPQAMCKVPAVASAIRSLPVRTLSRSCLTPLAIKATPWSKLLISRSSSPIDHSRIQSERNSNHSLQNSGLASTTLNRRRARHRPSWPARQ